MLQLGLVRVFLRMAYNRISFTFLKKTMGLKSDIQYSLALFSKLIFPYNLCYMFFIG